MYDLDALGLGGDYSFTPQKKKKGGRGGTITSLISEGGALGGAALGASIGSVVPVVGTAIGGAIGAGLGAFGGRLAENQVRDSRWGVGDAAKEGAMSAVLSAPLRGAKYAATAGKGLVGGAGLEKALVQGAEAASNMSLKGALGGKLTSAGDNLVAKQFRFTPTQMTNFKKKFGEDIVQTVKKYGVTSADDVATKAVQPLQQQFDEIVNTLPGISRETLQKSFKSKYEPLLTSAVKQNKAIGSNLKSQADDIFKKYGDVIDAKELNSLRKEFDSLVSYTDKIADPASYGVNKRAADAIRSALQESASSQGLPLKDVGKELNKVIQLGEYVGKQSNLGRGSLPLSIPTILGGAAGGTAFGPAGLATAAGVAAVNSNTGRKAAVNGLEKLGGRLASGGSSGGQLTGAIKGAARGQLAEGVVS